ncbi:MAG: SRPBCC family protein [Propionibacteriaceae bacterium]|nr:SRPBCC family protein [Propionibacteriaceae bacterium]
MNLIRTADWMRRLTVLADDERARLRHPEVTTEHLFLGLVSLGGPVTSALRGAGVTAEDVRRTFAAIHAERITGLGVHLGSADPHDPLTSENPIPPLSERGEVTFSDPALRLLKAIPHGAPGDATVALWTSLRADPLASVDTVLTRLGVDPVTVDTSVREYAERAPVETSPQARTGTWSSYQLFLAAPPDQVWALIADHSRWMEWNSSEHASATVLPDGAIEVHHPRRRRDGSLVGDGSPRALSHYREVRRLPEQLIEWQRTSPATDFRWLLQLVLSPAGAGTRLDLGYRYEFPGRKGLLRTISARVIAFTGSFYLRTKADDISRALG